MSTPSSIRKHPTHPMLIAFPLGLWVFSFITRLVYMATDAPAWDTVATYAMGGGLIGAVLAAVPGAIDLASMPRSRARTLGIYHGSTNVVVLVLLASAFFWRLGGAEGNGPFWLTLIGILLLFVGGWLGGSLVYVHGVGVEFSGKEERAERIRRDKEEQA